MSRVLAIDPGLANTGIVLFVDGTVHAVQTIRTDGDGPKTDFAKALTRCSSIAVQLSLAIERAKPDVIVTELYRDIPGHLRKVSNRWTTPLLIGYLCAAVLEDWKRSGITVLFQDPELVMTRYKPHVGMWADKAFGAVPGDQHLTNEHLRSAGAHGLHYLDTHRQKGSKR